MSVIKAAAAATKGGKPIEEVKEEEHESEYQAVSESENLYESEKFEEFSASLPSSHVKSG